MSSTASKGQKSSRGKQDVAARCQSLEGALWWLHGMAKGKPFKLTQKALQTLNVERDAASAALVRLEQAGIIRVVRKPGQRPTVSMVARAGIGGE
jgi:hypothetical protein